MFRNIILVTCVIGIIDKIITVMCGDKYNEQMRLITTLVLILALASSFNGKISFPELSNLEAEYENNKEAVILGYLETARLTISQSISDMLRSRGIEASHISINCSYDEYKYIRIDSIKVSTKDSKDEDAVRSILSECYPDADIELIR